MNVAKTIGTAMCFSLILSACGAGITQEEYDTILKDKQAVESELQTIKGELETAETAIKKMTEEAEKTKEEYDALNAQYEKTQKEYEEYQVKMKPYEDMTEAQAAEEKARAEQEAARIAEEEAAKKAAEEEAAAQKAAEEQAAKEAEEAKGYETGITYDQLARTPDDYEGKKVKFQGKVVQVIDGGEEIELRIAVNDNYDTVLYCAYDASIVDSRILNDDYITIYGTSAGLISYESTMGGQITIPAVWVEKIDQ